MTNIDLITLISLVGLIAIVLAMLAMLARIQQSNRNLPDILRAEAREGREDLRSALAGHAQLWEGRISSLETALTARFAQFAKAQSEQMSDMRKEASDGRDKLESSVQRNADNFAEGQASRLKEMTQTIAELRHEQKQALVAVTERIGQLITSNAEKLDALKETISASLEKVRKDNEEKLEQMRATVDEKLHSTLEKRLGESFQQVSDRLEQVHKGLGEMQSLATGVGDLKRVFSNVKARGGWGEMQLGMLLEDMLTPDQYATNVRLRPESMESVEFAVRLPGRNENGEVWLPIDAKFPQEDYERLLTAQDGGRSEDIEKAALALDRAVRLQAKTISGKYVLPPQTTEFAILYLPTEGLYAEVIRRPGLVSDLQSKFRIVVQGPTTLGALLNALQMGFRTLAIEKRSSEVWKVLGEAKAEFEKYGQVWDKLGKQLDTARRTVDEAGKRTRAVTRKLRTVETLEAPKGPALLELVAQDLGGDEDACAGSDKGLSEDVA